MAWSGRAPYPQYAKGGSGSNRDFNIKFSIQRYVLGIPMIRLDLGTNLWERPF
jgi:hypothetical protein